MNLTKNDWSVINSIWIFTYSWVFFILPWFEAVILWTPLMLGIACANRIEQEEIKKELL